MFDGTTADDWRELSSRRSGGALIELEWSRRLGELRLRVTDDRTGEGMLVGVAPSDANEAFTHPYAYADRGPMWVMPLLADECGALGGTDEGRR